MRSPNLMWVVIAHEAGPVAHRERRVGPPENGRPRGPREIDTVCGIRIAASEPRRRTIWPETDKIHGGCAGPYLKPERLARDPGRPLVGRRIERR